MSRPSCWPGTNARSLDISHSWPKSGTGPGEARERLDAVPEAYASISHQAQGRHQTEIGVLLHGAHQVVHAQQQLRDLLRDLLATSARDGYVRDDVTPEELATYCLHALTAAASLPSRAAVARLVEVTAAGLRPQG